TLTADNGVVYAGGNFTGTGSVTRSNLAAFDAVGNLLSWDPAVAGGNPGTVYAMAVDSGVIYAGGGFTEAGRGTGATTRNHLAAFDAAGNLLAWNPGASSAVRALSVAEGVIYAGGDFVYAGGGTGSIPRSRLAAFDLVGAVLSWNPGANATVRTLSVDNGVIYAGGNFSYAGDGGLPAPGGTNSRRYLAAFDTAGDLLPWTSGTSSTVHTVTVDNGVVYVGGEFGSVSRFDEVS